MEWSEFVIAIIAIATVGGVVKAALQAKYGVPMDERPHKHGGKRGREEIETLRGENARLIERVGSYEDRIAVLERIVTDSSYRLGHEIEALREDKGKVQ